MKFGDKYISDYDAEKMSVEEFKKSNKVQISNDAFALIEILQRIEKRLAK